jgi:hypothetical protein
MDEYRPVLVEALAWAGRLEEARMVLEKMFTCANHVGLYAEEIGATGRRLETSPSIYQIAAKGPCLQAWDESRAARMQTISAFLLQKKNIYVVLVYTNI